MDIGMLRKAVEWAELEAEKPKDKREWHQEAWELDAETAQELGYCGTTHCVGGWILHAAGYEQISCMTNLGVTVAAAEILGVQPSALYNRSEDSGLFGSTNTISDVRRYAEELAEKYGEKL